MWLGFFIMVCGKCKAEFQGRILMRCAVCDHPFFLPKGTNYGTPVNVGRGGRN